MCNYTTLLCAAKHTTKWYNSIWYVIENDIMLFHVGYKTVSFFNQILMRPNPIYYVINEYQLLLYCWLWFNITNDSINHVIFVSHEVIKPRQ